MKAQNVISNIKIYAYINISMQGKTFLEGEK